MVARTGPVRLALLCLLLFAAVCGGDSSGDCQQLAPARSARANHAAIMACLRSEGRSAVLGPGTFLLPSGLDMPANSSLMGSSLPDDDVANVFDAALTLNTTLLLAAPTAMTDFVLQVSSDSEVSLLILDAGEQLVGEGCCTSVLSIRGNNSKVSDVEVLNTRVGVGVHFLQPTARDNIVLRAHVHDCYYGVVFSQGLNRDQQNRFEGGLVEGVACDAISFAGYGEAVNNTVRQSGFACGQPAYGCGAGFFCRGSSVGGLLVQNEVYDTCGMALDVDSCSQFNISQNIFRDTGHDFGGSHSHCRGAATALLLDSQDFLVLGNTFTNTRASNRLSQAAMPELHGVFAEVNSAPFSDLPARGETVLNFAVLHRPRLGALPSLRHEVTGNTFLARCTGGAGLDSNLTCLGVAYFAGRGTGFDQAKLPGHSWGERAAKQPSLYLENSVFDSDVGSVRCGENWYAGSTPICRREAAWPCNEDDHLHPEGNFRNDLGCKDYFARTRDELPWEHRAGRLRNALPVRPKPPDMVDFPLPVSDSQPAAMQPRAPQPMDMRRPMDLVQEMPASEDYQIDATLFPTLIDSASRTTGMSFFYQ